MLSLWLASKVIINKMHGNFSSLSFMLTLIIEKNDKIVWTYCDKLVSEKQNRLEKMCKFLCDEFKHVITNCICYEHQ